MRAAWIAERPVAHRGLHVGANNIVENTASAFAAAVAHGFAMECDVQISADGEAMVFHDDTLDRMMVGSGRLDAHTRAALQATAMKQGADRMITLGELCDLVGGRSPLVVEIKAAWSDDRRLENRVAQVLGAYKGPVAVMSFDPGSMQAMRTLAPSPPRGVVQESKYDDPEWGSFAQRLAKIQPGAPLASSPIAPRFSGVVCTGPAQQGAAFCPPGAWSANVDLDRSHPGGSSPCRGLSPFR